LAAGLAFLTAAGFSLAGAFGREALTAAFFLAGAFLTFAFSVLAGSASSVFSCGFISGKADSGAG